MERRALAALLLIATAVGCGPRTELRGAVPLTGDGQASWVYMETRDPDFNGVWHCVAEKHDGEPHARCVKATFVRWPGDTPPPPKAR